MGLKKLSFQVDFESAGKRMDQFLSDRLPHALGQAVSKAKVRKLIVAGAVYLNGRRVRIASKEVLPGARIELFLDVSRFFSDSASQEREGRRGAPFLLAPESVLFEDEDLIAVNKPPGLPTQPTLDQARDHLFGAVKKFLCQRSGESNVYLGLHHRLDRDTSGVILFTKTRQANVGVAQLFSTHLAQKTYWAITAQPDPRRALASSWEVKNYLGKARTPGKRTRMASVRSGGDFAHTDFSLLESMEGALWIEASPRTGRTHQIRVHLSEAGLPLLGDPLYGLSQGQGRGAEHRTLLHAACLTFPHPVSKVEITVRSPMPKDFFECLVRFKSRLVLQRIF